MQSSARLEVGKARTGGNLKDAAGLVVFVLHAEQEAMRECGEAKEGEPRRS